MNALQKLIGLARDEPRRLYPLAPVAIVLLTLFIGWMVALKEVGAAWVQALGSIGAIIAATVIANQQSREAAQRDVRQLELAEARDRREIERLREAEQREL